MAQSLSAECTPLKTKYDSCFNAWLESYLSPEVTAAVSKTGSGSSTNNDEGKAQRTRKMARQYEEKCGASWKAYNTCITVRGLPTLPHLPVTNVLQRAVKEHKLEELINQAREENPLNSLENHLDRTHSP